MAAYLAVFVFLLLVCSSCRADDKLTPARPLSPGDELISSGGVFALGFFSLTNSSSDLYVGVWYNQIPVRTYVWVANRNTPIKKSSSVKLVLTNDSDLVLSDSNGGGGAVWTTANSNNVAAAGGGVGATAVLLDSGNFVVRLPNGSEVWRSFDHPTDTIVPNVSFSLSYMANSLDRFVAWRGPNDPSAGDFTMGGDSSSDLQIVVWNGTRPYWRRAAWTGASIFGVIQTNTSFKLYQTIDGDMADGYSFKLTVADGSPPMRMTLDYTGELTFQSWDGNTSSWTVFTRFPTGCDKYASCGPFGYCDGIGATATPTCKCLDGFVPVDGGHDVSRGCRRKEEEVGCVGGSGGDGFLTLPSMRTPDKFLYVRNRSFDQCTAECSRNCSCTAYAYAILNNADATEDRSRCLVWMGELVDTGKFSDGAGGENLYLRIPGSRGMYFDNLYANNKMKSTVLKIVLPVAAGLLLILVGICLVRKSRGNQPSKKVQSKYPFQHMNDSNEVGSENVELSSVDLDSVLTATNNFSDYNLLGKGGFGKVYKGVLEGGIEVAVKRLSKGSGQGVEEFRNEVVLIAKLQHRNLVRLLGCCIHEDEKLLIYEYLPNRSLDAFLFGILMMSDNKFHSTLILEDANRKNTLDWPTRFKIIKGVARGLLYLHQDSRLTIIHRDLKTSNILLDTEMSPKISDFGMARIFGGNEQQANTTRVVGTYGYMSPEYALDGYFSVKSDTYSFGVILLEVVSGLKISSAHLKVDCSNLIAYAWSLWKDGNARDFVDSSIVESCPLHEVLRCIHLGLLCIQDQPSARPLMSSIVFMLENETAVLPAPKEPIYFTRREYGTDEDTRDSMRSRSLNHMSITAEDGR
uniref:Receptor-like serine/threonine-protein kinase n=1 Tax=Oryza meridionalis TaxID=40149 RepID=A0A0E0DBN8_9ORYZ